MSGPTDTDNGAFTNIMPTPPQISAPITKAEASTRYMSLLQMVACVQDKDEFHKRYLGVARNILEAHYLPSAKKRLL